MSLDQYLAPTRAESAAMRRQEDRTFGIVMAITGAILVALMSVAIVRTIRINQFCGDPAHWKTPTCMSYMTNGRMPDEF